MVGLVDIAPASRTVQVRNAEVDIYGVSAAGIANLLHRFPELRQAFVGKEISVDAMMEMSGPVVAAVIAAGTGAVGDKDAERVAASLTFGEQMDLVLAIWEATAPKGVGPLVEKLTSAAESLGLSAPESAPAEAQPTKSGKRSKG